MSDLLARLWPAFQAESSEQLESLELALSATEVDALDVNDLFRAMHTIKGGCAMMGFVSMEAVAHAAEDLLDILRRGDMRLDDHLVDVLLESVDALKGQLQEAVKTQAAPQPAPTVVRRLRALVEASAPEDENLPASPTPPSKTRRALGSPQAASKAPDPSSPEAADASRQFIEEFAGFSRKNLASLVSARLFSARRPHTETGHFVQQARATGLPALGVLAERAFSSGPADLEADVAALVWKLYELEQQEKLDIGVAETTKTLAPRLVDARDAAISALAQSMQHLQGNDVADVAIVSASLSHAESLRDRLVLSGAFRSAVLMQVVMQAMRDLSRGAIGSDAQLLELLGIAATLPQELDDQAAEDTAYQAMCDQVTQRLLESVMRVAGADAVQRDQDYLARHATLCTETLQALSPGALEALREAAQRGERIFEIDADLEASHAAGEKLVSWLRESASVFTSYTLFGEQNAGGVAQKTRFGLVAAIPSDAASPEALLARLETEGLRARLVTPCDADASNANQKVTPDAVESSASASQESLETSVAPESMAGTSTMRVDSSVLDRFVDRVGEMVMLRNALAYSQHDDDLLSSLRSCRAKLAAGSASLTSGDMQVLSRLLQGLDARLDGISQADTRLQGSLTRLQEDVLALRVVPLSVLFNRLPRVVRDLSRSQNKHVEIDFSGEDLRVDKGMVDVLLEPLMHMVRNCVDHGIETPEERAQSGKPETAKLSIMATQSGAVLNLEIRDDGRGLDYDAIRRKAVAIGLFSNDDARKNSRDELAMLIFNPGFSTAEKVTEVSGRGVGMDVVRTRISHVGGNIRVLSEPGKGTCFYLRLPLTVAIQNVLLVRSGNSQFAVPERYVSEVISLEDGTLQTVQSQAACLLRGAMLPLYGLAELLGVTRGSDADRDSNRRQVVVLTTGGMRIGLLVDDILGRPEVFVRDVHPDIARMPAIGGVCILGGGEVVLILDGDGLVDLAGRNAQSLRDLLRAS